MIGEAPAPAITQGATVREPSRSSLRLERLGVRLPGRHPAVIRDVDLDVAAGGVAALTGPSGGGKSTLLHAIAGLIPWSRPGLVSGDVLVGDESVLDLDVAQRAHLVATCLDRPEAQLFLPTVGQELEAARSLHGCASLLGAAIEALGLAGFEERRVVELSSGERQRLALAVALAAAPRPVLLDEPTANLDDDGVRALRDALDRVSAGGGAVLLTEHAGWRLSDSVNRWLALEGGVVSAVPAPRPPAFAPLPPPRRQRIVELDGLRVERGGRRLLEDASLHLDAGEVVALTGANGAGKSSLARVVAGHSLPGGRATVRWRVRPSWVGIMLPAADLQLFSDTVAGELALSGATGGAAAGVLSRYRLEALAGRAPWTLSRGERHRLVHAAIECLDPPLLILDEPAQGLDPAAIGQLAEALAAAAARGRATLILTHRAELAAFCHRRLHLEGGHLVPVGAP